MDKMTAWKDRLRLTAASMLAAVSATLSPAALAQCWPAGRNLSAVELTACFMAEYRRCEEQVPGFKARSAMGIDKFTNRPRYREIAKSRDFERLRREAYRNLAGQPVSGPCDAKLAYLDKGNF